MSAARELRLAQRALRTAATHLEQARYLNPLPLPLRDYVEALGLQFRTTAWQLNSAQQISLAADSALRRARRDAARRAA